MSDLLVLIRSWRERWVATIDYSSLELTSEQKEIRRKLTSECLSVFANCPRLQKRLLGGFDIVWIGEHRLATGRQIDTSLDVWIPWEDLIAELDETNETKPP